MTREEYDALSPEDKIALVKKLIEQERMTYDLAADFIGGTRNMIAGLVYRNGIKSKNKPGGNLRYKKLAKKVKQPKPAMAAKSTQTPDRVIKPKTYRPLSQVEMWSPLPGTNPVSLMASRDGMCRWTVGRHSFCGQPGFPFCERHAAMAYRSIETNSGVAHGSKQ